MKILKHNFQVLSDKVKKLGILRVSFHLDIEFSFNTRKYNTIYNRKVINIIT